MDACKVLGFVIIFLESFSSLVKIYRECFLVDDFSQFIFDRCQLVYQQKIDGTFSTLYKINDGFYSLERILSVFK